MSLHMSERDNDPADYWRRHPGEAHGRYEPPEDRPIEDGGGIVVWLVGGVAGLCAVAMVLHFVFKAGLL